MSVCLMMVCESHIVCTKLLVSHVERLKQQIMQGNQTAMVTGFSKADLLTREDRNIKVNNGIFRILILETLQIEKTLSSACRMTLAN